MKYLIIDKRGFVGNDVLFWGKKSCGYVTDIDKAERYDENEARKIDSGRSTDVAIPEEEVEQIAIRCVDVQYLDRRYLKEGFSIFRHNQSIGEYEEKINQLKLKVSRMENIFEKIEYWEDDWGMDLADALEKAKKEFESLLRDFENSILHI